MGAGQAPNNRQTATVVPSGENLIGFDRGLKPEKILGATDATGKLYYLIKWQNSDRCDLVHNQECHQNCPSLVIKYLEDRLTWKSYDGKEN